MAHYELIKLTSDILLVMSVAYLGIRFLRSSKTAVNTTQLMILEASLKGLIKDAEGASRMLNDELLKRQRSLEKLLGDLEGSENRAGRAMQTAEEARKEIDSLLTRARSAIEDLSRSASRPSTYQAASHRSYYEEETVRGVELEEDTPEPPSFETIVPERRVPVQRRSATEMARRATPSATVRAIEDTYSRDYEPIEKPSAVDRLSSSVEKEVSVSTGAENTIRSVFGAAEDMLRAGRDLEYVAARTRLPIEKVRTISQSLRGSETLIEELPDEDFLDPRLGVLGAIKRQTEIL